MAAEREPPEDIDEFLDRHRDVAEPHADSGRPASWLTEWALGAADPEGWEREEDDER
ncbi:MAG: hypothetical protein ABEI27_13785 [Halobellus sp.]|uniref:hypothetical protein n=1 Tax=Halobellus sp. TaxID=1979212 RepID=UPI0035D4320D